MNSVERPLVSVVIPAYNAERYIRDCVLSVLDQGDVPLEVIVVDDGSTDSTAEIVGALPGPVRYVHQLNAGSAVARNAGIAASRGAYIAFCDSDDLWVPGHLRQQVDFMQRHPDYEASCGRFQAVDAAFPRSALKPLERDGDARLDAGMSGWMYLQILRDSVFHLDTLLLTRAVAGRVAFDPRYRRGQDFDFFLQLAQATPIAQIDAVYACYRHHADSITNRPQLRNYRAEVAQAARTRWGLRDPAGGRMAEGEFERLIAQSWFSHGWELYHAAWYTEAASAFRRCLALQPLHPKAAMYALRSRWRRRDDRMPADARPR